MNDKEEQIAFKQWVKDWGHQFPKTMSEDALWLVYRSMDLENRKEFLAAALRQRDITDKEKIEAQAEQYKNKLAQDHYGCYLLDFAKMCFQDGAKWVLAEGRKESAEEIDRLKAELDSYKALDSHYDEIEEDSKWVAEENARLKADLEEAKKHCAAVDAVNEKMKCCGNCKYGSSHGVCISPNRCKNKDKWELMK